MFPTSSSIKSLQALVGDSLYLFLPELAVCAGIVVLLLTRLVPLFDRVHLGVIAVGTLVAAIFASVYQLYLDQWGGSYFAGMLVSDPFAGLVRLLVLVAALLTVLLTQLTGIPDRTDSSDFHTLLLGGTLGMLLMASANHLLMVFIAVEMASLPGYALAGFLKGKKTGSEAALKYVVYGAAASGVMLYGITLLAGVFGSASIPDIARGINARGLDLPVLAGASMVLIGLGFKLAAVPVHFWCPDVFEGAAAEVAGFLSVASKTAAMALTIRFVYLLHTANINTHVAAQNLEAGWGIPSSLGALVGVIGAVTVTFGNLAAFGQTNVKRLFAYSTIAHAGYMLLAVGIVSASGTASVLYYLAAYIVMNLGAFAVVALVRNSSSNGDESIDAFRGLVKRSPVLAVTMTVFLLSLLGLPPLAGFAGKFQVFAAVYDAGRVATAAGQGSIGSLYFVLFGIGAVNTAISAYYYLKIARAMLLDEPTNPDPIKTKPAAALYLTVLALALFVLGILWDPLIRAAEHAHLKFF